MLFFRNRRDFSEPERVLVSLLRDAESMRVYDHVSASPWITRRELSDALKVSRTAVNWHLRILTEAGLVGEAREQGMGFLFATREGKESLASVAGRVAASATEQASALTQSLAAAPRATA
jgi:DNA-binding transcriptional ArsR family regulator